MHNILLSYLTSSKQASKNVLRYHQSSMLECFIRSILTVLINIWTPERNATNKLELGLNTIEKLKTLVSGLAMPRSKKIGATWAKTLLKPFSFPTLKLFKLGNVLLALCSDQNEQIRNPQSKIKAMKWLSILSFKKDSNIGASPPGIQHVIGIYFSFTFRKYNDLE